MSEGTYLTAIKAGSARGWRRVEPLPFGQPEQPQRLLAFLNHAGSREARRRLPVSMVTGIAAAA